MAIPFLSQLARHYAAPEYSDLNGTLFVFPSRRSLVYFRDAMKNATGDPTTKIHGTTINDFFYRIHGVKPTDRLRLVMELYEVYKQVNPKAEPLDDFIFWGKTMIADFDNIDKYLADARGLFVNVSDFKAIQDTLEYLSEEQRRAIEQFLSHFRDSSGRLTVRPGDGSMKTRFLQVWDLLYPLYDGFKKRLGEKGLAYEGMVYRSLAEKIKGGSGIKAILAEKQPYVHHVVFAGLNALNECEKTVLRALRDERMAEFVWDFSSKEIKDPANKASFFMAKNVREFPQAFTIDLAPLPRPEVTALSVPSATGQAKAVTPVVVGHAGTPEECVVVLPDESLLMPVLSAIPPAYDTVNITMGYPMSRSAVYSLHRSLTALQLSARERNGEVFYHYKSVTDVLSSALVSSALTDEEKAAVDAMKAAAKVHVPESDLRGGETLETIFRKCITDLGTADETQNRRIGQYLDSVILHLGQKAGMSDEELVELDFAKRYHEAVGTLLAYNLPVKPSTWLSALDHLVSDESVPFEGEPLKGLQVMGTLETRALDFKTVIILSANEDVFPHRSADNSFIPPELRKAFGLPTLEYQDAVWAYYFYRLIQRAEKVIMVYDSRKEGVLSGEESRYIKQLEYDFGFPVRRLSAVAKLSAPKSAPAIQKTQDDVDTLRAGHLSASALQNYLACPAKFYYQSVKGLRDDDELLESPDAARLGTIFHACMQTLYSGRKSVTADDLREMLSDEDKLRSLVRKGLKDEMHLADIEGRNLVITEVIFEYLRGTLRHDLNTLVRSGSKGFRIIGLERYMESEIEGFKVIGFVDRIDSYRDGEVRVVDYKTGHVEDEDINITDRNAAAVADKLFGESNTGRPKIALQLYLYGVFAHEKILHPGEQLVNSIYSTGRMLSKPLQDVPENRQFASIVQGKLKDLLHEIADTSVPFRRTEDNGVCQWCSFRGICGK